MPAYIVMDLNVLNPRGFGLYVEKAAPLIARYGGRNLLLDSAPETLEGAWQPSTLVIQEFPDAETVHEWWNSPEYQPLKQLRRPHSTLNLVVGRTGSQPA